MKRLMRYFVISLICNIAILVFLFLPHKNSGHKPASGSKPEKSFALLPANICSSYDKKSIDESLNNHRYRPAEVTEDTKKNTRNIQDEKPDAYKNINAKKVIEIPDIHKKEKQFMTSEEYKDYKKSLPLDGTIVTEMSVNFPEDVTERTMREIISFFGFKIVAYPSQNPDYLLVCEAPEFRFEKLNTSNKLKKFYSNNSNRTIEPENGLLNWTRSELTRQGIDANGLNISIVLGDSAGYFHWKEMLAAESISRPITDVSRSEASISRTPQGYWLLLVNGIYLKDGQYLNVDDQELKEILL
ncbi:MAG: hypothetical protein ACE5GV_01110 [Candidatus Scalindua sp.]